MSEIPRDAPEVEALIASYFAKQLHDVMTNQRQAAPDELPLARIKRIMKQDSCDPLPRMISADSVPFMALTAQLFIGHVTQIAWKLSTIPAKRNTLQLKDLKDAIACSSKFDFLIDVIDTYDEQKRMDDEAALALSRAQASAAKGMWHADELLQPPAPTREAKGARAFAMKGKQGLSSDRASSPLAVHSSLPFNRHNRMQPGPQQALRGQHGSQQDCHDMLERLDSTDVSRLCRVDSLSSLPQEIFDALDADFDQNEAICAALAGRDPSDAPLMADPFHKLLDEDEHFM